MKYVVMNGAYEWVHVDKEQYDNVPSDMIHNKASVNPDGLVTISVANIMQDQLSGLVGLLKK